VSCFARPSFLRGVASVLDLGGVLTEFNQVPTPQQADEMAMRMDWEALGRDLRLAMAQFEREAREASGQRHGAGEEVVAAG